MNELDEIRTIIEESKLKYKNYQVWDLASTENFNLEQAVSELPFNIGKGVWKGILLNDDVKLNLGGKHALTSANVLCINSSDVIHNFRISLIGPDVLEISKKTVDFAMMVLIGGKKIEKSVLNKLKRTIYLSNEIDGLSLRSISRKFWYQISNILYDKQVSFKHIGIAFIALYLQEFEDIIESIEVVFIIDDEDAILKLIDLEPKIKKIYSEAFKDKIWKYAKQRDDCDFDWECAVCDYQSICNEIRNIIKLRENKITKLKDKNEDISGCR
ncbi:MAG: hypothetical protein GF364_21855 [Candidatus Lokiarchaeota archaeon]|nr:hypothetical protein [Candidatus Lokiarchaeota archaeon]